MKYFFIIILVSIIHFASCRDFYVGMFKKYDLLVAQDRLYKEQIPFRYMTTKYGRIFNCKISYIRVSDRLGYGPGPTVRLIRGGLRYKYLVLRLTSPYNSPISVNIYVGCPNTFTTPKLDTIVSVFDDRDTRITTSTKGTVDEKPGEASSAAAPVNGVSANDGASDSSDAGITTPTTVA